MNRDLFEILAKKRNEMYSKKDSKFASLWNITFFMQNEEIIPLKVFTHDIDTLIESIGDHHFIHLQTIENRTIINTDKIVHVEFSEEASN